MRGASLGVLALLVFGGPAGAATYYVDASIGGTTTGNIGYTDYVTPLYSFQPGDTIDFGSVEIDPYIFTDHTTEFLLNGGFAVSFSGGGILQAMPSIVAQCLEIPENQCAPFIFPPPNTVGLIFTLPENASTIQLAWTEPFTYTPAVPEPSTWAMLLIGFAGIGFAGYRKSRRNNFTSAAYATRRGAAAASRAVDSDIASISASVEGTARCIGCAAKIDPGE